MGSDEVLMDLGVGLRTAQASDFPFACAIEEARSVGAAGLPDHFSRLLPPRQLAYRKMTWTLQTGPFPVRIFR